MSKSYTVRSSCRVVCTQFHRSVNDCCFSLFSFLFHFDGNEKIVKFLLAIFFFVDESQKKFTLRVTQRFFFIIIVWYKRETRNVCFVVLLLPKTFLVFSFLLRSLADQCSNTFFLVLPVFCSGRPFHSSMTGILLRSCIRKQLYANNKISKLSTSLDFVV